ncbi:MAG: hypothetical protein SGARI_000094 [Bacillariaceae sp.]
MSSSNTQLEAAATAAAPQSPPSSVDDMRRKRKQVSFGLQQTKFFNQAPQSSLLETHERKTICWYSDEELRVSRDEARRCIRALQQRLQQEEQQQGGSSVEISIDSLVMQCPVNPSETLCLRGIEKYADAEAKYQGQKRHVGSVLHHHVLSKNNPEVAAFVSQTLSQPFKDVAHYYAIKSAEELAALRTQEEQERQQVASAVLQLLLGGTKKQQQLQEPSPTAVTDLVLAQDPDGRRTPPEMVSQCVRIITE